MITKEFSLGDKVIIPMRLKNHAGISTITGTFFVYDDEELAKKHINPTIFSRLEKSKNKLAEAEKAEEAPVEKAEEAPAEKAEEAPVEKVVEGTETKSEKTTPEESKEEKSE